MPNIILNFVSKLPDPQKVTGIIEFISGAAKNCISGNRKVKIVSYFAIKEILIEEFGNFFSL